MAATSAPSSSNTETVRMHLPSGETINGVVPAGLSDDEVKSYVRMKRPDLFGAPAGIQAPQNPIQQDIESRARAPLAGVPGGSSNPVAATPGYTAAVGAPVGGAAAYMGGVVALPFLRQAAIQHPLITTMAAQEAIHQARQIPGVGRFIPGAAEWLPFLLPSLLGNKPRVGGEPDATLNGRNVPEYAGEDYGPMEQTPPAQKPNLPFLRKSTYPPEGPQTFKPQPTPEAVDRLETRSIQERVRDAAESEDATRQRISQQEWFARNDPSTPKGELIQNARGQNPQPTPPTDDLTPLLKKSLAQARKRRTQ